MAKKKQRYNITFTLRIDVRKVDHDIDIAPAESCMTSVFRDLIAREIHEYLAEKREVISATYILGNVEIEDA